MQVDIYTEELIIDHTDFIIHLGSTQNSNEGTLGIVDALFQIPDLFFKKEAGNRRLNVFRNPCYRSVRAVTAAKSIIYKKVCPFCQLFGELRIILLFTRMKTDIFAEDNLPGLGCIHYLRSLRTHAIFSKMNRNIYQLCKMIGYRLQAEFRIGGVGRTSKVTGQYQFCTAFHNRADRCQSLYNTVVVCNYTIFNRDVKIDSHQYRFPV